MDLIEWLEISLLGLLSMVGAWFKNEHARVQNDLTSLKESDVRLDKDIAIIKATQQANKESIDKQFELVINKLDHIDKRMAAYDENIQEFYQRYELKLKQ